MTYNVGEITCNSYYYEDIVFTGLGLSGRCLLDFDLLTSIANHCIY